MSIEEEFEKIDKSSLVEINKVATNGAKALDAMNEIYFALKFGLTDKDRLDKIRKIEESFRNLEPELPTKKKEKLKYSPDLNRGDEDIN